MSMGIGICPTFVLLFDNLSYECPTFRAIFVLFVLLFYIKLSYFPTYWTLKVAGRHGRHAINPRCSSKVVALSLVNMDINKASTVKCVNNIRVNIFGIASLGEKHTPTLQVLTKYSEIESVQPLSSEFKDLLF